MTKRSPYPIERLQAAAKEIRARERETVWLAVADWLDREASLHLAMTGLIDLMEALMQEKDPLEKLTVQWSGPASMAGSTIPQALAVAEAYLARAEAT